MPTVQTTQPGEDAPTALGKRFWVVWGLGMAVLLAGVFVAPHWIAFNLPRPLSIIVIGLWGCVVMLGLVWLARLPRSIRVKRGAERPMSQAARNYTKRLAPAMLIFVVCVAGASYVWQGLYPKGWLAWAVAIASAAPLMFAVRAIALRIAEETDEYLRSRLLYSHTFATHATLAACCVYGFLDLFELVPHVQLWVVFPIWALFHSLGWLLSGRKRA